MWNEEIDIGSSHAVAFEDFVAGLGHFSDRKFENSLTILMNVVHFLVDGFVGGRIEAAASRHVERDAARTIHFVEEVDQSERIVFGGLDDHGAGSVTEDDAGGTIGEVDAG